MGRQGWTWVLVFLVLAGVVVAQEGEATKTTLNVGVSLTDGNSETLQGNGALLMECEKEGLGSVRAGVEANYGESTIGNKTDTTSENGKVFANVKKTLSEMMFVSLDGSMTYDNMADVDYRAAIGPGVGVYFVKSETTALSLEIGPSYLWEKVAGVKNDYLAARATERIDHKLSETAKVWQSVEFTPEVEDFGNYLVSAEIGAEAALNSHLNLRIVLQDKYDSEPGGALEKNDLMLIGGIGVTL